MHDTDPIIRLRIRLDPDAHCELAAHLNSISKRKWGDRVVQLATIGLIVQSKLSNTQTSVFTPTATAASISAHSESAGNDEKPGNNDNLVKIFGSHNDFAQSIAALNAS
jgi:hypothetical protein